jgi:hypothetical protein
MYRVSLRQGCVGIGRADCGIEQDCKADSSACCARHMRLGLPSGC